MKKKDIEQLLETEHKLWEEFRELASGDKFVDYLAKVYKKKIRRSKKKQPADRPSMSEGAFALCAWIRYARAARRGHARVCADTLYSCVRVFFMRMSVVIELIESNDPLRLLKT